MIELARMPSSMAPRVARGRQSMASRSRSIVVVRRVRIGFLAVPGERPRHCIGGRDAPTSKLLPTKQTLQRPLRVFLGAFGEPGHAFPMLALGERLVARGHEVVFETWKLWQEPVQAAGMTFLPAPEYPVFGPGESALGPHEAVVRAARHTRGSLAAN